MRGLLKFISIIAFWVAISFFWVSLGQSQSFAPCRGYQNVEIFLEGNQVLADWFHYYLAERKCEGDENDFFKVLATSETLSTKLNQARVKFHQFYVPLFNVTGLNWERIEVDKTLDIQSDLKSIENSLTSVLSNMNPADADYLRATVLLTLPSDFVEVPVKKKTGKQNSCLTV